MSKRETQKLTFPRLEPYRQVGDYLNSKVVTGRVQLPTFNSDQPRTDPEVCLAAAERNYKRTLGELEERREFYKRERLVLDRQWEDLEVKEKSLRDNFVKLSAFIKSNQEKRHRAGERKVEDAQLVQKRIEEIEKLKEDIGSLEERKKEFDKENYAHKRYENYLHSVIEVTDEFRNPADILDRYESLIKTKNELGQHQADNFTLLENSKSLMAKKADENNFRLLGMSNSLADFQKRYQNSFANAMHWEKIVWSIRSNALQKFKDITEVKQASWNIYALMSKRKGETTRIPEDNFERQLFYIKRTLQQLVNVTTQARRTTKKKSFTSMKVESSKGSQK